MIYSMRRNFYILVRDRSVDTCRIFFSLRGRIPGIYFLKYL